MVVLLPIQLAVEIAALFMFSGPSESEQLGFCKTHWSLTF